MDNGNRALFYDIFKGHRNTFYLYGHVHGESSCYRDFSSGAVLHLDEQNVPLGNNRSETDSRGKTYAYSLVHMGGLRPFGLQYFEKDGIEGFGGGRNGNISRIPPPPHWHSIWYSKSMKTG